MAFSGVSLHSELKNGDYHRPRTIVAGGISAADRR